MSSYRSQTHSEENYSLEFEETSYDFSNSEDSGSDLLNQAYIETPPFDESSGKLDFPIDKCDESRLEVQKKYCHAEKTHASSTETATEESSSMGVKADCTDYSNRSADREADSRKPISPLLLSGNIPKLTLPQHWRRPPGTLLSPFSVLNADMNKCDDYNVQSKSSGSLTSHCPHLSKHPDSTTSFDCDICIAEKENKYYGEKNYAKQQEAIYNNEFSNEHKTSPTKHADKLLKKLELVSSINLSKEENCIANSIVHSLSPEKRNSNKNLFEGKQIAHITPYSFQEKSDNIVEEKQVEQKEFSSDISSEEPYRCEDFDSSDSDESTEHSDLNSEVLRQLKFQQVLSRKYTSVNSNQVVNPVMIPLNNIVERGMGVKQHVYHDELSTIYEVTEGSSRQSKSTSSSSKGSLQGSLQKELYTNSPGQNLDMSPGNMKKFNLAVNSETSELEKYDSDNYMSGGDSQFSLISPKPTYSTPKHVFLPKSTTHSEGSKRKYLDPPVLHKLKSENYEKRNLTSVDVVKQNLLVDETSKRQWEKLLDIKNNDPRTHIEDLNCLKDGCTNVQRPLLKPNDVKKNLQSLLDSKASMHHTKSRIGPTKTDESCSTSNNNLKTSYLSPKSTNQDRPKLRLIKAPEYLKIMSLSISDTMSDTSSLENTPIKPTPNKAKVFEESMQEQGILEEPDLTLVPPSLLTIHEETQYNKKAHDSPSLMSFLQHEMSCMQSGNDTGNTGLKTDCNIQSTTKTMPAKRDTFRNSKKFPNVKYQQRTKRLWNNLEEVKKKKSAEELKEAAIINRQKAKEFSKNLTPKKKSG